MTADLAQAEINYRTLHDFLNVIYHHQKLTGKAFNYGDNLFRTKDIAPENKAYVTNVARQQGWIEDREVDGHRQLSITGVGILILKSLRR